MARCPIRQVDGLLPRWVSELYRQAPPLGRVERFQVGVGQRVVVNQGVLHADEEGASPSDIEVEHRDGRAGLEGDDARDAAKGMDWYVSRSALGTGLARGATAPDPAGRNRSRES